MKKALREMFLLGVGAAALTKKQADKVVAEVVKKGKLTKKEGDKLVGSIMKESKAHREKVEKMLDQHSREFVKKFGPAARKELDKLSKLIVEAEKKAAGRSGASKAKPRRKAAKKKKAKKK